MPALRPLLLAAVTLLFASPVVAQLPNATDTTATPAPGDHDYLHSPVETVNPANGSVSIRIPVRMPEGRLLTVPFAFAYDTNGAHYIGEHPTGSAPFYMTTTTAIGQLGGWSYSYPVLSFASGTFQIPGSLDHMITCHGSTNYVFQGPDGDRYNLGLSVSANVASPDGVDNCNEGLQDDGEYASSATTDSAGPILGTTTIPSGNTNLFPGVTVVDGNGTTYNLPGGSPGTNGLTTVATNIVDRNGNTVTISNSSGAVTYTDTIGRTALHTSGMGANPDTVTVAGMNSPYYVYWTTTSASFSLNMLNLEPGVAGAQNCPTSMGGTSNAVSSIVLPNGQQFSFSYESTYGMISKIVYPSGGYVRYVWGLNPQAEVLSWGYTANGGNEYSYTCRYDYPAVTDRYVSYDGSTEALHQHFAYYTNWSNNTTFDWNYKTTTVTTYDLVRGTNFTTTYKYTPLSSQFVPNCGSCYMTEQVPTEQSIAYGDIGGGTIQTVTKSWKNIRLVQTEQTALNNGQSSLKVYCYNSWEEPTEVDEYDFGSGSPSGNCATVPTGAQSGGLLRKATTSYATFAQHIVDLPSSVITYDYTYSPGSATRVAETDYPSYDANGNLKTQTKDCFALPTGTACPQGNSTTQYTYDSHGQMATMTDPKNNPATGYSYTDNYSSCGGSAPPTSPSDAYLTQVTDSLGHTVSYCYDYAKGLLLSSTDENSQTTNYKYNEVLDRLTEADYPDGGQTLYAYHDTSPSPSITANKKINSSQTMTTDDTMNGLDAPVEHQVTSDPEGTDSTVTVYDGLGRTYKQYNATRCSTPTTNCGEPTWGYTTYVYDALGRAKSVTDQDGSVASTTCSGNCATVTDEAGKKRESCTNGLGQMNEVIEDPGGLGYVTNYTYDALGNLISVVENGSRNRNFSYNSLSELTSSTNPEAGTISYAYDANGNVTSKTAPAPNQTGSETVTTTYGYDALNRITSKTYSDGTPAMYYSYDADPGWAPGCCTN